MKHSSVFKRYFLLLQKPKRPFIYYVVCKMHKKSYKRSCSWASCRSRVLLAWHILQASLSCHTGADLRGGLLRAQIGVPVFADLFCQLKVEHLSLHHMCPIIKWVSSKPFPFFFLPLNYTGYWYNWWYNSASKMSSLAGICGWGTGDFWKFWMILNWS